MSPLCKDMYLDANGASLAVHRACTKRMRSISRVGLCGHPLFEPFERSELQATRWSSQQALQRIGSREKDPLEALQIFWREFLREEQLDGGIPEVFKQGDDHSGRLIGIGGREDAFPSPLLNNLLQPGRESFDAGLVEFVANNGILVAIPDGQVREDQALVREFPLVERGKEALELLQSTRLRIMDDGEHDLFDLVPHVFDQREE